MSSELCLHTVYGRSALDVVFDRSCCSEMCLVHTTQGQDKPCLSKLSQRLKIENGSPCLHCQSILSINPCFTHATEVTITTKDRTPLRSLMESHNQLRETFKISICILEMFFFSRSDMSQPWSYASSLSMSIDLFYWSPIQKCLKSHLIWRLVFTVVHAVCLQGYDDIWGCEFRIKNSVFQGLAFSSGISPLRSYSQQHSGKPMKMYLRMYCREVLSSKTLIILKTCRPGGSSKAGVCRIWRDRMALGGKP